MARNLFCAVGANPVAVDADKNGLRTTDLHGVSARLAYVTPSHQFPLDGVMPVARRQALLDWAEASDAFLVEDDYDGEYRYDIKPVPPLFVMSDSRRVIYLGTVSKTLSPTLRLGYLVLPPQLCSVFITAKERIDRHTPSSEQDALACFLQQGAYERHIRKMRRRNGERRAALLRGLSQYLGDRAVVQGSEAGLHLVVWLPTVPASDEGKLVLRAQSLGLGIFEGFAIEGGHLALAVIGDPGLGARVEVVICEVGGGGIAHGQGLEVAGGVELVFDTGWRRLGRYWRRSRCGQHFLEGARHFGNGSRGGQPTRYAQKCGNHLG